MVTQQALLYQEKILKDGQFLRYFGSHMKKLKGNKCEKCGSTKFLHFHHTSYSNVTIHTLKLLCRSCHFKLHSELRKESVGGDS